MTTITDEMLSAFLDGELGASQADEVRVALDSDPALRARLAKFEQADATMRDAASNVVDRRLPQSVMAMLAGEKTSVAPLKAHRPRRLGGSRFWPTALAASIALVLGLTIGVLYQGARLGNTVGSNAQIAARVAPGDPLFEALESTPSGQSVAFGEAGGSIQPMLSFASASGDPCREFMAVGSDDAVRAVACRERNSWRIDFAVRSESAGTKNGYQTASASDARLVSDYISDVMVGDAFGRETETEVMAEGWRGK
ncbi:RseA family anti-sigma factor [Erythrobacter sp.]|uniref:RseA family anti-sigma factor n=1 Tax=Erythrobacter sp. TaxID=1042 RepID=UPI001B0E39DC|nr:RseA family anti-sigma factor [Erythrobacter sp.]MBO6525549.1 hypothetical protein [Erythrobacter sp.]MBO6529778.1 hypothetical protein [Erythrobacter sp.]